MELHVTRRKDHRGKLVAMTVISDYEQVVEKVQPRVGRFWFRLAAKPATKTETIKIQT
jgi:hypothetical protein